MRIGDAVRFKPEARHRDTLGPMADQIGRVIDVATVDGIETLVVTFGDNGPLEAGVPAAEFEIAEDDDAEPVAPSREERR